MVPGGSRSLSGERFAVVYRIAGEESQARQRAREICVEQTIEFPAELIAAGAIHDHVLGRIESFGPAADVTPEACPRHADGWEVTISYAVEVAGSELTQLINVVFGNVSLIPGIRLERLELSPSLLSRFRGPRFGRRGLRQMFDAPERPLLATAIKPMGLSGAELAGFAHRFALGGIDIVKDDHGLTDQSFGRFRERLLCCVEQVELANRKTGGRSIFMPNVTADGDQVFERARLAREAGAGGLLVAPGLVGFDTVRALADDDQVALPILSHPSYQGSYVANRDSGISHYALFGQLARLAGADGSIYPNYGGRFAFTRDDCRAIAEGTAVEMGEVEPIFPAPGGGMSLDQIPDMRLTYGRELIFLIGGALHRGEDLAATSAYFRRLAEEM